MKFRHSLAYRLSLFALALAIAIGVVFSTLQVFDEYEKQVAEHELLMEQLIDVSKSTATRAVHTLDERLATEVVKGLLTHKFIVRAVIEDELGEVLAYDEQPVDLGIASQLSYFFPQPEKIYRHSLQIDAQSAGQTGQLILTTDRTMALMPYFQRAGLIFVSDLLRYILMALALFVVFHSRLTRPLNRLVRYIDDLDLSGREIARIRVPERHARDELGRIAAAVNRALETVGRLMRETREQQQVLRESERHKHEIINAVPQLLFARDAKGRYVFANQATAELLDADIEEVIGRPLTDFISRLGRDLVEQFLAEDQEVLKTGKDTFIDDVHLRDPGGNARIMFVHRLPFDYHGERIVLSVATDVTEQKRAQEQIRHQAFHDSLTDLPNRALLLETLQRELDRSRRHGYVGAVLFIDLDHFKKINDSLGHPVGDVILQNVAQRLKRACRGEDTIARLGGDEFIIVLPELDRTLEPAAERALDVAEKVRHVLSQPVEVSDQWLNVTCSIGIAMFPEDNTDVHAILRYADTAMYHAKEEGRDAIEFFSQNMASIVNRHLVMEGQLRQAIDLEEFVLYFQPQVGCRDNRIVGAEILIRWQHPEMGLVPPGEFIPILESSKLIVPVGLWILRTAFMQVNEWVSRGLWQSHWKLGINISPKQFRDKTFVDDVKALLQQTRVDPRLIEFEITESIVIQNLDEAVRIMIALRDLGISFSLDDFGTGYSSLGYLKALPVDAIKIDRSFVRDMCDDSHDLAIIDATLALSRRIGLSVVAEGVESEDQLSQLRNLNCQSYQGFLYSRPVPAAAFEALSRQDGTLH